jgi:hypothetical protein
MCSAMCLCAYVVQKLIITFFLVSAISITACNKKVILQEVKPLPHYPSASGIEYLDGNYYIIGDDASNMIILDSNLNITDSVALYSIPGKRISKSVKPDLESISILPGNKLLLIGSGSAMPQRNIAWIIDPATRQKDSIRLDTFYQRLLLNGIKELNIEGSTAIPGSMIMSNRGSKGYTKNHLIFTSWNFRERQTTAEILTVLTGTNSDTSFFNGISGMAHTKKTDKLIMTVSTEDTRNSMDDGAIGKSYLWIINNISSKKRWKAVNPDKIIDLVVADARFKGHKIESVCITKETNKFLYLVLVADNDDGSSTLFRMVIPNK